jgi:hypothetical protein
MKRLFFLAIAVVLLLGVMLVSVLADTEVAIDIKPCKDPNYISLRSRGTVPVAVLTTDNFDARDIDPDTVLFAGASPVRWAKKDVDEDGDKDMLFHFEPRELDLDKTSTEATLTGETYDGELIWGTDSVIIK